MIHKLFPFSLPVFVLTGLTGVFFQMTLLKTVHADLFLTLHNNKGARFLVKNNPKEAEKRFLKALEEDSLNPFLHFHLGLSFELGGEKEKALKQYKTTLSLIEEKKKKDKYLNALQFKVHFNLARLYSENSSEDIEKALGSYQKALEFHPESKEVKTNIELLWKMSQNSKDSSKDSSKDKGKNQDKKKDTKNREDKKKGEEENQEKDNQSKSNQDKNEDKNEDKNGNENSEKENPESKNNQNDENKEENREDKKSGENEEDGTESSARNQAKDFDREREQKGMTFKSQNLTKDDVARILEEIKNQEQKIRVKEYSHQSQEGEKKSYEKNW